MTLEITEHNAQTGEIITRPMNDDEYANWQKRQNEAETE